MQDGNLCPSAGHHAVMAALIRLLVRCQNPRVGLACCLTIGAHGQWGRPNLN